MPPLAIIAAGLYQKRLSRRDRRGDGSATAPPPGRPLAEFRALMGDIEAPEDRSRPHRLAELDAGAVRGPTSALAARSRARPPPANRSSRRLQKKGRMCDPRPPRRNRPTPPSRGDLRPSHSTKPANAWRPSWMQVGADATRHRQAQALYGVIAGTCALIGIAALVPAVRDTSFGRALSHPVRRRRRSALPPRRAPAAASAALRTGAGARGAAEAHSAHRSRRRHARTPSPAAGVDRPTSVCAASTAERGRNTRRPLLRRSTAPVRVPAATAGGAVRCARCRRGDRRDDAARTPDALHRDPAEGVAREA